MLDDESVVSIVVTSLRMKLPALHKQIEDTVQLRSRVESFGNAVFTYMLITRFESSKPITKHFVSQASIGTSCIGMCT